MRVDIQARQFTASEQLVGLIQQKIAKLEQFFDKIIDAEVFLSLDGKSATIKDKMVRLKINIPGGQLIITESSKKFEIAIDTAVNAAQRKLKQYKQKKRHPKGRGM